MDTSRITRLATTGVAVLALGFTSLPAAAAPIDRGHVDEVGSISYADCGLELRDDFDFRVNFVFNPQGRDRLAYYRETVHGSITTTNLSNDQSMREVFNFVDKDHKVTDNGDGTLTIVVLAAGTRRIYGPDGKIAYNDPGQTRFELLVDHAGTPSDPSDDAFPEFVGVVKGSTGRNDSEGLSFCDIVHNVIGED